jgi:UDP-N-acetylglucosamine 2-epimerase (non-hydrolysing)
MEKEVVIIIGTRPEAIKMIPIYFALKKEDNYRVKIVSTGQHKELVDQVYDFFLVNPEIRIKIRRNNENLADLSSILIKKISITLKKLNPDFVIVQGDTTSALCASLAAFYLKLQVLHVEAGLRTYDRQNPFPEEMNRQIIDKIADFHFSPTEKAAFNLTTEGIKKVYVVGNTAIDALFLGIENIKEYEEEYEHKFKDILKPLRRNILITGHRRESFGLGFKNITRAIKELSIKYLNYNFIYPVHLNPNVSKIVNIKLSNIPNIKLIEPVNYGEMIFLMLKSYLILTDSGGIQEEAPSLNIPVLVMRNTTERQEGIEAGCSLLVGTSTDQIVQKTSFILDNKEEYQKMANAKNPYGTGNTATDITKILNNL